MTEFSSKKLNNRRYKGVRGVRPDLKALKVKEANERLAYWTGLSLKDQLASLDQRLGKDVGAKRQRAKIQALLDKGFVSKKDSFKSSKKVEK